MTTRKHKNNIQNLITTNGTLLKNQDELDDVAISYFNILYNAGNQNMSFPPVICRELLNVEGKIYLNSEISDVEVKQALYSINNDTAPRPDGFNATFYKHH